MWEVYKNRKSGGNLGNRALFSSVSLPERDAPRITAYGSGGGENRLYAITSHQEYENPPDVFIGIIKSLLFMFMLC